MDSPLVNIVADLINAGFEAKLKKGFLFSDKVYVILSNGFIKVNKDSGWYCLEYWLDLQIVVSLRIRILGNTNRDNIELVKMIKHLSEYVVQ